MDKTGNYLTGFFSGQVFASRGGVFGHPWPRLRDNYAAQKAKEFPGRPPLIRTGLMNRSFKKDAGRLSVKVFNEVWYSRFHQEGTRNMPQRVLMDIDHQRVVQIVSFINGDIQDKMRQANV